MTKEIKLESANGSEFLKKEFPKRELIIEPFLTMQGLMMIHAKRGIGKTYFAMTLAAAMASANNLFEDRFKVKKKWKVLYLDGEMSGVEMQERLGALKLDKDIIQNISIINPEMQSPRGTTPNLATEEGQKALEPHVQEVDVIIVDNLSTLARSVSENQANSWDLVQEWALRLRAQGKSIIFIHHAGKNNTQRGTSRKEDVLDTVINLKHPKDYDSKEGARFQIHFEKSRSFTGEDAEPFEVRLEMKDFITSWKVSKINTSPYIEEECEEILELSSQGISQRKIAEKTGKSLSTVNRILKAAND